MTRTQIYLSKPQHKFLKTQAANENVSMSELIRRSIDEYVKRRAISIDRGLIDDLRQLDQADTSGKKAMNNLLKIKATEGPKDLVKDPSSSAEVSADRSISSNVRRISLRMTKS